MTTSTVLAYHAMTSRPRSLVGPPGIPRPRADFVPCRPSEQLPEVKQYPAGLTRLLLPTSIPLLGVSAERALEASRRASEDSRRPGRAVCLADLARLLYYSAGVVRYGDLPQRGRIHFRAAGSAGALCPLELYVVGDGDGLPAGVWHFDPIAYCLTRVAAASPQQGPYLVITGIPARSGWKYADAAYRHLWWDCGTLLAQLMIVAHASGLPAWIQLEFADDAVAALVGADRVHELPLAIVPLGKGPLCPENPVAAGQAPETGWLGANVVEYPLVTAAHRAGEVTAGQREGRSRNCAGRPVTGDHAPASRPAAELRAHAPATAPGASELLETLILRRGSTRRFDPSGPIPAAALEWALMAGLAPVPWDVGPSLLQHHVLAHQVPDLPCPGLYRWTGRRLAAASPHLAQPRQAARRLCADIGLAQDAACVAVHCADLREVMNRLGERGYRAAMLEAGFAHGRFLLALFALGYGGTALMTSEAPAELGTLGDALLATAAGVSAYRSKAGGAPLAPVRLTQLR